MHAHILPREWPDMEKKFGVSGFPVAEHVHDEQLGNVCNIYRNNEFFRRVLPNCWDIELRIAEYAEHNIAVQLISTVPVMFNYWAPAAAAAYFSSYLNDDVAALQQAYPKQVIALGTLPMQHPNLAIKELQRLHHELELPGIQIGSNINDKNLDDPEIEPIFAAAEDLGIAIMVHPWEMMGRDKMGKYWLPWLVGMPAEMSRAICSLIFGGVMEKFPRLRFCFAHGGGSFPWTIGRIAHGFDMRPDLVAVDNPIHPTEYLKRFWVDSVTHDPRALQWLLEIMGDDRVMLGTDYPFPLGEQAPGKLLDSLQLEDASAAKIFAYNALDWLNLDPARFEQT